MIRTLLLSSAFFFQWTADARLNGPRSLQSQLPAATQFAIQAFRTKKILELVTDEDISGSILNECQGDCDSDDNCDEGLVCFQRHSGDTAVPGCAAGTGIPAVADFCIKDPNRR